MIFSELHVIWKQREGGTLASEAGSLFAVDLPMFPGICRVSEISLSLRHFGSDFTYEAISNQSENCHVHGRPGKLIRDN